MAMKAALPAAYSALRACIFWCTPKDEHGCGLELVIGCSVSAAASEDRGGRRRLRWAHAAAAAAARPRRAQHVQVVEVVCEELRLRDLQRHQQVALLLETLVDGEGLHDEGERRLHIEHE